MWRYAVGAVVALLLGTAAVLLFGGQARERAALPAAPKPGAGQATSTPPLPDIAPSAPERSREQKRFDRYDKDRNGIIARAEYLEPRRKAFAKLDRDGDGKLSFEEWAVKTTTRFDQADKDRSGTLTRDEFATTAPKRKPAHPRCACPKPAPAEAEGGDD